MAESQRKNLRKSATAHKVEGRTDILITFGLGAIITSVFGVGSDFVRGWQSTNEQRCTIAQQVVLDEAPSPALNAQQRTRLSSAAMRKVELCMRETS